MYQFPSLYTVIPTEYRDAFALFDKRGDNKIDSDQIGDVLRALGLNPTQQEVKKIVQEIDPKGKNKKPHPLGIFYSGFFFRQQESFI